jgi:hypothetical protein
VRELFPKQVSRHVEGRCRTTCTMRGESGLALLGYFVDSLNTTQDINRFITVSYHSKSIARRNEFAPGRATYHAPQYLVNNLINVFDLRKLIELVLH